MRKWWSGSEVVLLMLELVWEGLVDSFGSLHTYIYAERKAHAQREARI